MMVLLQVVLFETGGYHGFAVQGFIVPSPSPILLSRERRCQQLQQRHHSSDSKKVQLLPNDIIDITETTDVTNGLITSMIGSTTTTITTAAMPVNLPINIPTIFGGLIVIFIGWLYIDGNDDRNRTRKRIEEEEEYNRYQLKRYQNAVLDYKEYWTLEELSQYDGTGKWKSKSKSELESESELELELESSSADNDGNDSKKNKSNDDDDDFYYDEDDGPILFAADGLVFNVYKGRNFYGMGGEYHIFAGRDATRLLAKTKVEEESSTELTQKLNIAERAALAAWIYTFKSKGYDIVGKLQDFDPSTTSMM